MTRLRTHAPGKVNLCLLVGEPRADGYHPLVSVFLAVDLADALTLEPAGGDADEVRCAGVEGPNLASAALAAYRERTGYDGPAVRVTIDKRVPVAAGMGGGSGDAAAALRLIHAAATGEGIADGPPPSGGPSGAVRPPAAHSSPGGAPSLGGRRPTGGTAPVVPALLAQIAPGLGADVPFALHGGRALVTGIGEHVEPLAPGPPAALVLVPSAARLSTPAVYGRADTLPSVRTPEALAAAEAGVRDRIAMGGAPPAVNDLEPAARDLCPDIDAALDALARAGAQTPIVSGSGPTTFGAFDDPGAAAAAARTLRERFPGTVVARPASPALHTVERLAATPGAAEPAA